jgi:hypothetical protein
VRQYLLMTSPAKIGRTGCCVCDAWADGMVTLERYGSKVCRECAGRIGRFIRASSDAFLAEQFFAPPPFRETAAFGPPQIPSADGTWKSVDVEEVFEDFKKGVENQLSEDDVVSRMDLAIAYDEIGRIADAVCSATFGLAESQSASRASHALNWIFAPERGRPGAFRTIVLALKGLN